MSISVLIVDDVGLVREKLRAGILSILPRALIYEAESAPEAGRFLMRTVPDVLFLDLTMPGVSGLTFLDKLDVILAGRKPPIVVSISSDLSQRTLDALQKRGAYDTLPKPFDPAAIADVVLRVLEMQVTRRVLLVDDSGTVRTVVRRIINRCRFTCSVHEAADGETALAECRRNPYDIVFMDLNLPGIDGLEAAGEILYSHPETHVIMMSGDGDEQARRAAAHIGIQFFLKKPFFASDVDAVLHSLFELRQARFLEKARSEVFQPGDHGFEAETPTTYYLL